ncbi:MAG: hypothetical protein AAB554_05345 [Patescibacteria group bacterium]
MPAEAVMSKTIPNVHSAAECWNPHYHEGDFKPKSAVIFKRWYIQQYHGSVFTDLERFAVAPLCVFGSGTICEYTREASSLGGTYAVCPKCREVIMCGYLDDKGLNPRACPCGAKLAFNDYFQPVRHHAPSGTRVDPAKDPAVTVAELCAYQDDGVPSFAVASWIVILAAKDLLTTGGHLDYGRFEVRSSGVESPELRDAFQRERWTWLDPTTRRWHTKLGDRGKVMLKARGVAPTAAARKEIERLRGLLVDENAVRLKAEALAALAVMLNR